MERDRPACRHCPCPEQHRRRPGRRAPGTRGGSVRPGASKPCDSAKASGGIAEPGCPLFPVGRRTARTGMALAAAASDGATRTDITGKASCNSKLRAAPVLTIRALWFKQRSGGQPCRRYVRRDFRRAEIRRPLAPDTNRRTATAGVVYASLTFGLLQFLLVFGDFFNLSGIFTAGRRAAQRTIAPSPRSVSPPPIAAALGLTMLAAPGPAAMAALPRADRPIAVVGISAGHAAIIGAIGEAGGSVLSVSGSKVGHRHGRRRQLRLPAS